MPATTVFVPDPEWPHNMLKEDKAKAAMQQAVDTVASLAIANVPNVHGGYAKAFMPTVVTSVEDGAEGPEGYVGTTFGLYHLIEFGGMYNQAYHPFGLGVQQAGLRFEPAAPP